MFRFLSNLLRLRFLDDENLIIMFSLFFFLFKSFSKLSFFRIPVEVFNDSVAFAILKTGHVRIKIERLTYLKSKQSNETHQSTLFDEFFKLVSFNIVIFHEDYGIFLLKAKAHVALLKSFNEERKSYAEKRLKKFEHEH